MAAVRGGGALLALAAAALLAGCGDEGGGEGEAAPELVVFAASSLGPAFEDYGETITDAEVRFSFAGSDELAAQIRQGAIPDVYAAANTELPDDLASDGLLESPRVFVTNELVVGVPAGSEIDDVTDLEADDVTVAIGDEDVPVGTYTREVLAALGPDAEGAILDNVASSEPEVAGIVAKLSQGAVDAGFVYRSDVDASDGELEATALSPRISPDVAYGIARTAEAEQPDLARQFVDGVLEGEGRQILLDAGFGPPPG